MMLHQSQQQCSSRSLTEVFILMRNNVVQSRQIFADVREGDDRMSLVSLNDSRSHRMPPEWVNMVDEVQYELTRVRTKVKDLRDTQTRHVLRPNFDDDHSEAERVIKAASDQILSMLTHCNRLIQHIRKMATAPSPGASPSSSQGSEKLLANVVHALGNSLAELSSEFRACQQGYLHRLETREDSLQQYFDAAFTAEEPSLGAAARPGLSLNLDHHSMTPVNNASSLAAAFNEEDEVRLEQPNNSTAPITMAQLQMIDEQSAVVQAREREILQISKSLLDLNSLFKDVGQLVVDQGSVVDRIDYNIEQSAVRVQQGLQQVKKAESYQKKNRKMIVIVVLSAIIILLFFLLIIHKS